MCNIYSRCTYIYKVHVIIQVLLHWKIYALKWFFSIRNIEDITAKMIKGWSLVVQVVVVRSRPECFSCMSDTWDKWDITCLTCV